MKVKFNQFKTKSTQSSDSKGSNSMKKNRKLTALLVAACMTLPMAATTFTVPMVASAGSITITDYTNQNDDTANKMTAYQVFTGSYEEASKVLSITGWGADFDAVNFINSLKGDVIFDNAFNGIAAEKTEATAQQVATEIAKYNNDGSKAKAEAVAKYAVEHKGGSGIQATKSGEDYVISNLDDGYYVVVDSSAGIDDALTLGLLQVAGPDGATVTPKRVVPTVTKTAKDSDGAYDSVVDCYKGETVNFKVEVAVPDLSRYNDYYLEIEDTLGTDFESLSGVTLKNGSGNPIADDVNCDISTGSNTITIKIENAKIYSGQTLSLEYSATLKATATTGENAFGDETQINKVFVKYLSDPNNAWKPTNGSAVETPGDGFLSSTTEAEVRAYTYKITIDKIEKDIEDKKLEGAKFKLRNSSNGYVKKSAETGDYTISWGTEEDASVFETDENGAISIVGLDAGTYYLEETVAPSGYNRITDPIMVTITPTYDGTSKILTNLSGTVEDGTATADKDKGEIKVQIANNKGAQLPSTGGIGTKIFYILGGTLVIGSGAALVIKKRMSKDEE